MKTRFELAAWPTKKHLYHQPFYIFIPFIVVRFLFQSLFHCACILVKDTITLSNVIWVICLPFCPHCLDCLSILCFLTCIHYFFFITSMGSMDFVWVLSRRYLKGLCKAPLNARARKRGHNPSDSAFQWIPVFPLRSLFRLMIYEFAHSISLKWSEKKRDVLLETGIYLRQEASYSIHQCFVTEPGIPLNPNPQSSPIQSILGDLEQWFGLDAADK